MELNDILPKKDDPQRLIALNGVPRPFYLSAEEINLILNVIARLLGNESALYKDEWPSLQHLEAAHPLPEPGSYAQIIVQNGNNLKASWDNTNKKWFLDGDFVPAGSDAAYLLRAVHDADNDGIIDKANDIYAVLTAGGTKYYGTKNGVAGVFDFPNLGGGGSSSNISKISYFNSGYQSGLTYQVTAAWTILSENFGSIENPIAQGITLAVADATNARIDVIALNSDGSITKITGVPAANPVPPSINPNTQLEGTFILIPANATTPDGVSQILVYDENTQVTGGEFNTTEDTAGARINLASTVDFKTGTKCIEVTDSEFYDTITFTPPTPLSTADLSELPFHFRNKPFSGERRGIFIRFVGEEKNGKRAVKTLSPSQYDKISEVWQFCSVSLASLDFPILTKIEFVTNGFPNYSFGFFLDNIKLTSGTGGVSGDFVTHPELQAVQDQVTNHEGRIQTLEASMAGGAVVAYPTMADLYAAQANQVANGSYRVDDASAHSEVTSGRAWFDYKGTTEAKEEDYILRSEEESLNLDAQLTAIENRLTAVENGKAPKYGTRAVLAGSQIDWADGIDVYTIDLTGPLVLNEINLPQGSNIFIKKLIANNNHPVTMPGAHYVWKGGVAGGVSDAYVFDCINGNADSLKVEYTITPNA